MNTTENQRRPCYGGEETRAKSAKIETLRQLLEGNKDGTHSSRVIYWQHFENKELHPASQASMGNLNFDIGCARYCTKVNVL